MKISLEIENFLDFSPLKVMISKSVYKKYFYSVTKNWNVSKFWRSEVIEKNFKFNFIVLVK